jgi:hypothetical protein
MCVGMRMNFGELGIANWFCIKIIEGVVLYTDYIIQNHFDRKRMRSKVLKIGRGENGSGS